MKQTRFVRMAAAFLCTVLLLGLAAVPAYANSAQSHWSGIDSTGAIVTDENCPIVVERERLTFALQEFPSNYYSSAAELERYPGSVTAEYAFHNPSNYTVTATLVFPFGKLPSYAYFGNSAAGGQDFFRDAGRYGITVDGEPVDLQVRHTLSYGYEQFSLAKDLPLLSDGYVEDPLYRPGLPVTVLHYTVSGVDAQYNAANVALRWTGDSTQTRILVEEQSGGRFAEDQIQVAVWANNGESITVYLFGQVPAEEMQWTFYENGAWETEIEGTLTLSGTEQLTFEEYAMRSYPADAGILAHDWYNAVVAHLNYDASGLACGMLGEEIGRLSGSLMRWYQYELALEPGQRVINTVTAPIYPAIDTSYEPDLFRYTYLLSPAQAWSSYGELEIVVNTPFYLSNSRVEGFEKTEAGYTVQLSGLPDGELTFDLAAAEKPVREANPYQLVVLSVIVGIGAAIVLVVVGAVLVVTRIHKKRAKNR